MQAKWSLKHPLITGVLFGSVFGISLRLLAQFPVLNSYPTTSMLMTLTTLCLAPAAMGYITVAIGESAGSSGIWQWIVMPWLPIVIAATVVALFQLEGLIRIIFLLPIALVSGSIGGIVAGLTKRQIRKRKSATLACVAILPILLAPLESQLNPPMEIRQVETSIVIHAAPKVIWDNIKTVPAIDPVELKPTWVNAIGFPRPIEATLSRDGVGGVRHARFERGLLFVETVDQWQPEKTLAFSIHADTQHIPPTTLDEHVTIGGRYFDVLHGEYRLEPLTDGNVALHLSSDERLSTDFNEYAGLWSDAVMRNIQQNILAVIKNRCEHANGPSQR